jgi:DNA-binding CsgD family transcriptional regulator
VRGSPDEEQLERAIRAVLDAARALDASPRTSTQGVVDADSARHVLHQLEAVLSARRDDDPHLVLNAVRLSQAELAAGDLARERSLVPVLNRALDELRSASTIVDLVEAVPYQSVQLGYDRALFSWVERERWVPRCAHISEAPSMAKALVAAGGPPYAHTRQMLEIDIVRERRSLLVRNVEGNPRVHQGLWAVTQSRGYVAAPVVSQGRVAAFVHLDRHLDSEPPDEFDRDLLAAFCQGVGLMLDKLYAAGDRDEAAPDHVSAAWPGALTRREKEVLALVAAGLTNAEIGARLYIGEETVKTHLKRLTRKLRVSSRSQAAAAYGQLNHRPRRPATA